MIDLLKKYCGDCTHFWLSDIQKYRDKGEGLCFGHYCPANIKSFIAGHIDDVCWKPSPAYELEYYKQLINSFYGKNIIKNTYKSH